MVVERVQRYACTALAAIAAGLTLAGCSAGSAGGDTESARGDTESAIDLLEQQTRFHAQAAHDPRRLSPLVEVTSEDKWALIAWKSEAGICLDFAIPGNSPFACGFPVQGAQATRWRHPTHTVAGFISGGGLVGGDGKATIFGVTAAGIAAVKVQLRDGRLLDARVHNAPSAL